jgi:arginase family enzyme
MSEIIKIFGMALDYLDDKDRVELKRAYLKAVADGFVGPGLPKDPYDEITPLIMSGMNGNSELMGKIDVPGWLTPRPCPEDINKVEQKVYSKFMDSDGPDDFICKCAEMTADILPSVPLMIGVDHAVSAGPIKAISKDTGPKDLTVVVLDSHFDAVPAKERVPEELDIDLPGEGLCGDFLGRLIKDGHILAENLFVVGVSDFPPSEISDTQFAKTYNSYISSGVKIYPKNEAVHPDFPSRLTADLENASAKNLYVSLDADVGSLACMDAVRFLDCEGIGEDSLLNIAKCLRSLIKKDRFNLCGMDLCEVDVHMLGLERPDGKMDQTARICADFILELTRRGK